MRLLKGVPIKAMVVAALAMLALPSSAQRVNPLAPQVRAEVEQESAIVPTALPTGPAQLEATDLNAFLDGYVPYALANGDVAGAVVVVVKDGRILTQRGYGFSDMEKRTPVDPRTTLFRPGSVSKLFTWTAVMQQVEQGKLDLDADVNQYLDFKIPPYQGKPVTLRQILQHTAGFEEAIKGLITNDSDNVTPYDALLKRWIPHRVYAPGSTPAYSNYATSLAGYMVQRVSGENFYDYVDRHIFAPLGMVNSSFRQPLPPRLRPMMSKGYRRASGEEVKFEIVGPAPAGSLSSTGEDMARFMIAHLQGGAFGASRILQPQTAQLMHRGATFRAIPNMPGMELGFYETDINGREAIAHAGDTGAFHSDLHLFLNDNVGIFISMNSGGRDGASLAIRTTLFERFADRYFPTRSDTRRVDAKTAAEHARMMAGSYLSSRRAHSSFFAITSLLGQNNVSVGPKGELIANVLPGLNGQPRRWVEVAPFLWVDPDSHERLGAVVRDGKVVRWSIGLISPFTVYDRTPWYQNSSVLLPLVYFALAVLLLTVIIWPTAALVRRRYGATLALEGRALRVYRLSKFAALAILLTLGGWLALISIMSADLDTLSGNTMDPFLWLLLILSLLVFVGGLAVMLWNLWQVWRGGGRRWPAKVWSVALVIAAAVILWVAVAFNLISFTTSF
jgi:CubicO group peptidase (beta-lactamase class C family)